jgi:phytoene/squalene synthetase
MSTTSQNQSGFLQIDSNVLEIGYQNCKASAKQYFGPFAWVVSNTDGGTRRSLDAVFAHVAHVCNFLELLSTDGLSLDSWSSYRNEVSEALTGRTRKTELAALNDTVTRFKIPKQFIFDPLNAVDQWVRNPEFETLEHYNTFTSLLGGSVMAATLPILEIDADPKIWQPKAIRGGQAILQAQLLSTFVQDLQQGQMFIPPSELKACKVDLEAVRAGKCDKSFRHFCRVQASRIEAKLEGLGQLVHEVEFDGQRCLTSLLGYYCHLVFKIKADPSLLFEPDGVINKREAFKFKAKHWMGLESKVAIIPEHDSSH